MAYIPSDPPPTTSQGWLGFEQAVQHRPGSSRDRRRIAIRTVDPLPTHSLLERQLDPRADRQVVEFYREIGPDDPARSLDDAGPDFRRRFQLGRWQTVALELGSLLPSSSPIRRHWAIVCGIMVSLDQDVAGAALCFRTVDE
jgi:hypothetical protein